ncbi:hypothetical protein PLUTE_b0660 [Pseudoalteromonas luteoviolacea DSM 6061]|nr:hypothetical protein [Pseudoalteromonas luteoviolacea DSM 6061]
MPVRQSALILYVFPQRFIAQPNSSSKVFDSMAKEIPLIYA